MQRPAKPCTAVRFRPQPPSLCYLWPLMVKESFNIPLDQSLTDLMAEKFGIIEHRAQINMHPTALTGVPAKALGVAAGTPSL